MGEPLIGIEHGKGRGQPVEAAEPRLDARGLGRTPVLRARLRIEQSAERRNLAVELFVLLAQAGKLEALSGDIANLERDGGAGRPSVDLDMLVPPRPERQVEGLAPVEQILHGLVELGRRGLVEPLAEAQQPLWLARHAELKRQIRDIDARSVLLGPGQQHLRLGGEDRLERALARAVAVSLERGRVPRPARGLRRAQADDGGADGKGDDAEIDAEREQQARSNPPAKPAVPA